MRGYKSGVNNTMSAFLPGAMVPSSPAMLRNSAAFREEARMAVGSPHSVHLK